MNFVQNEDISIFFNVIITLNNLSCNVNIHHVKQMSGLQKALQMK